MKARFFVLSWDKRNFCFYEVMWNYFWRRPFPSLSINANANIIQYNSSNNQCLWKSAILFWPSFFFAFSSYYFNKANFLTLSNAQRQHSNNRLWQRQPCYEGFRLYLWYWRTLKSFCAYCIYVFSFDFSHFDNCMFGLVVPTRNDVNVRVSNQPNRRVR